MAPLRKIYQSCLAALLIVCLPLGVVAQTDAPLRRLLSANEAKDWYAVGRLNIEGAGFCTGALIAPDLVLTAAHCLFNQKTGKPVSVEKVNFLAGWRKGWAAAHRNVRRIVLHPNYVFGDDNMTNQFSSDIALIELDTAIRSGIEPFAYFEAPRPGDQVSVVSYAKDRPEMPALQEPCHVLMRQTNVLILSCDVNFGASGAPIFVMHDGKPKIASVISSMANMGGRDVSVGTSLGLPLEQLIKTLNETSTVYRPIKPLGGSAKLPQVSAPEQASGRKTVTPPTPQ